MITGYHVVLLRVLYFLGCIGSNYCSKTTLLYGLPGYEANKACEELLRWNYMKLGGRKKDEVSLNPHHIQEVRRLLNPRTSIEYSYDTAYQKQGLSELVDEKETSSKSGFRLVPSNQTTTTDAIVEGGHYNDG
jgi:hypothetical protein